ncbi:MAG: YjbE family putative metal transport protein [Alphaproteobacteria bacterium]|nr:YjbE family putative metal transport protein [Alphaproteobacteria bacterium]MCW5743058.1 YjbE family putative metal transport protein [Alphaproteobacteria bacterium]
MPDLSSAAFWAALGKIIVADIILAGDNAVVIALAARNLEERHRKPAILLGSFGAIALRVVFVFIIGLLLSVPYLKLVGGVLLLWIGVKLLTQDDEGEAGGGGNIRGSRNLWGAIWTIIIADAVMSLDNAIAIAGAANNDGVLVILGLLISIPIIIYGSTLLTSLLRRYPVLVVLGGALLGWIGGEVMSSDGKPPQADVAPPGTIAFWLEARIPYAHYVCAAAGAVFVVVVGKLLDRRRRARLARQAPELIDLAGDDGASADKRN